MRSPASSGDGSIVSLASVSRWEERAAEDRRLGRQVGTAEADRRLLDLLLDSEDMAVSQAAADAVLERDDASGLRLYSSSASKSATSSWRSYVCWPWPCLSGSCDGRRSRRYLRSSACRYRSVTRRWTSRAPGAATRLNHRTGREKALTVSVTSPLASCSTKKSSSPDSGWPSRVP